MRPLPIRARPRRSTARSSRCARRPSFARGMRSTARSSVSTREAATGGVYFEPHVAGLYCFTTRERMRRRGLASALVHASHAAARARGVERTLLQATASGTPVYTEAGYREERTLPFSFQARTRSTAAEKPYRRCSPRLRHHEPTEVHRRDQSNPRPHTRRRLRPWRQVRPARSSADSTVSSATARTVSSRMSGSKVSLLAIHMKRDGAFPMLANRFLGTGLGDRFRLSRGGSKVFGERVRQEKD